MDRLQCLIVGALFVLAGCQSVSAHTPAPQRPNVIVIVSDDQGWADIGYHNDEVRTPNLDALAANGVELDAHYVQPQCTPTRVALMTGRYPSRFGPQATAASNDPSFPIGTLTMARMFKAMGYDTALMGKWHMGSTPEHGPNHHGFDHSYGSLTGAIGMYDHRYRLGTAYETTWHRNHVFIQEQGHVTDLVADEAIRYIRQDRDRPFFLYLPFHAVHTPIVERDPRWHAMNAHIQDESRRKFLAAASHLDDAIGQIVAALDERGERENTLILFTSDNGGIDSRYRGGNYPPPDPALEQGFSSNAPLRGGKRSAYEGGVRVPAFVAWPGTLKPSKATARMHVIDWMPTLAGLIGFEAEEDPRWDGHDLWPILTGEQAGYPAPRSLYTTWNSRRWEAVHHGDLKIVRNGQGKPWQLYNLATDPGETADLAHQQPEQVEALQAIYQQFRQSDQ